MITSTLTLYKHTEINPDKNFIIENIATYLSTNFSSTALTVSNFQYVKITLNPFIKIAMEQIKLDSKLIYDYDYMSIKNGDNDKTYYFFILSKKWNSANTVELQLAMDTLNTFEYDVDYTVDKKTLVLREHKDRFSRVVPASVSIGLENLNYTTITTNQVWDVQISHDGVHYMYHMKLYDYDIDGDSIVLYFENPTENYGEIVFDVGDAFAVENQDTGEYIYGDLYFSSIDKWKYVRNIDLKSENINTVLYKKSESEINDATEQNWLLLYKNRDAINTTDYNQVNPVECFMLPKNASQIKVVVPVVSSVELASGEYCFFFNNMNKNPDFDIDGNIYRAKHEKTFLGLSETYIVIAFWNNGGIMKYAVISYNYTINPLASGGSSTIFAKRYIVNWTTYTSAVIKTSIYEIDTYLQNSELTLNQVFGSQVFKHPNTTFTYNPNLPVALSGDNIDRTDSKNIKLFNLPYCPVSATMSNGIPVIPDLFTYDSGNKILKLNDMNAKFINEFTAPIAVFSDLYCLDNYKPSGLQLRNDKFESKLYHSDYYQMKFVYDSFNKIFALEQMEEVENPEEFDIKFVTSRNIISKFMFQFPQYKLKHSMSDFDNVVLIARNNEEVLYTSAYINYIKTGYNYDLKNKERSEGASLAGLILSGIGTVAGAVAGGVTGNPIAIGTAIGAGVSTVTSVINYAKTVAQNEANIAQKLDEANRQAVSVASVDDVDLLTEYANNKAKIVEYGLSDLMRHTMGDVFYYCGYEVNTQKKPNVNNRLHFNFVQANLVINGTNNLVDLYIEDIKNRFQEGVTFFHYTEDLSVQWDIGQIYENWETSLIEEE